MVDLLFYFVNKVYADEYICDKINRLVFLKTINTNYYSNKNTFIEGV